MPRKTEHIIDIPTYQKYWVCEKDYGHDIVIYADTGKTTIKCKWPNRKRGVSGRVEPKCQE